MFRRRTGAIKVPLLVMAFTLMGSLGCWEQWSNDWFPQMKWQPAVQAFERTDFDGRPDAFLPPEGSVPIDGGEAPIDPTDEVTQSALVNPRKMSLESLENGRHQYQRFCATCHGEKGMGDGPVSMTGKILGPLGGVLPMVVTAARSDGHVYSTIRYGRRRMPSYQRILSDDRWDIVNYIRYMTGQKGVSP
ncbi:MAG: cytochrome c [Myxococcales bacterium]|nr:cytochrome c [Myxococcales bacterium]